MKKIFTILYLLAGFSFGQQLYFTDNGTAQIDQSEIDGTNTSVLRDAISGAYGICTDMEIHKVFFTSVSNDAIYSISTFGGSATTLFNSSSGVDGPRGIALDGNNSYIYWVEAGSNSLRRANYDGSGLTTLISGTLSAPVDVEVDFENNFLFISQNMIGAKGIYRCNPDGSMLTQIVSVSENIGGLALDLRNNKIYWTEYGSSTVIKSSDLAGENISQFLNSPSSSPRGITLDVSEEKIFWSDPVSKGIYSASFTSPFSSEIVSSLSSPLDVAVDWYSALPVELTTFDGSILGEKICLKWETETETNNYGFEIERASEPNEWNKIGFKEGNGESNSPKSYSFIDSKPAEGKISYRLKQIDFDGKATYSKEIEINYEPVREYALAQNYPNPFNPTTKISFSLAEKGFVSIKIFNSLGEEVKSLVEKEMNAGRHEVILNASDLASGTYICRMSSKKFSKTVKMLLVK